MSYSSEVLADSPLAYWRLGETSGATASDSSGNGRDCTYNVNMILGATGLLASDADLAASFNGSNAYCDIAYASWMDTPTAMTVEAWIKTSASGTQAIVDRDDGSSPRVWQFRLNGAQLEFVKISGGVVTATTTGLSLNDGSAHHVAVTYDGSNIRLYADGALIGSPTSAPGTLTGARKLQIGVNDGGFNWFLGVIDETAYYGSVLSGTRLAAHYAAGIAAPGTSATGSITLSGSAAGKALPSATGSLTLAGTGTASASAGPTAATATASLTLSGTAIASPLYVTDTSNALDGLDITFTGTATVVRPPAPVPSGLVLAEKYDKAIAYPQPVMDNGRPT